MANQTKPAMTCWTIMCDPKTGVGYASGCHAVAPNPLAANEVACTETQAENPSGWKLVKGELVATTSADVAPSRAQLLLHLGVRRRAVVSAGMSVGLGSGTTALVDTDDAGRVDLHGLAYMAQADANYTTVWKQSTGNIPLDAAQITSIARAVAKFVESCYAVEAQVEGEIAAGAVTSYAQVDDAAWPSSNVAA